MCDDNNTSTLDGGHRSDGMTRRAAIGAGAAGGVALLFAGIKGTSGGSLLDALGPDLAEAAAGTCTMTPAKTVGPYFVDEKLSRSDVRTNSSDGAVQAGVPLTLRLQVFDADNDCAPVKGATVDIWHANATGIYSDVAGNNTVGQNWLRGYQTHGRRRPGHVHDDLSRLVHGPRRPHPLQGAHLRRLEHDARVHVAAVLHRRDEHVESSRPTARTRTARARRRTRPTPRTGSTAPTARRCCSRPWPAATGLRPTSPSA